MGTVLNNRTVEEMRSFFETHGSRGPYVRGNSEATDMWLRELKESCRSTDDMQPLHLSRDMCQDDMNQRPTAAQVVSEILDFQGETPYCGYCCDSENGTLRLVKEKSLEKDLFLEDHEAEEVSEPLSIMESTNCSSNLPITAVPDERRELSISQGLPPNCNPKKILESKSNWRQPMVEDCEETLRLECGPNSPGANDDPEVKYAGDKNGSEWPPGQNLMEIDPHKSSLVKWLNWYVFSYLAWEEC